MPELVKYAQAKGDGLFFGSAGNGSAQHLVGEMFNRMAGTKMKHVPFRGNGPATTALLSGEIQVFFDIVPTALNFAQTGKLRALATTGKTRSPVLPTCRRSRQPGTFRTSSSSCGRRSSCPKMRPLTSCSSG